VLLFEQTGLTRSQGIGHLSLSVVALDQGDYDRARVEAEQALALQEKAGDRRAGVNARAILANIAMAQGDLATAEHVLRNGLQIVQEVADPVATAGVLERYAVLLTAQGQPERALVLAGAAASLREANGAQLGRVPQLKLEAELEPARNALGLASAAAAFEAGRQLSATEAITQALARAVPSAAAVGDKKFVPDSDSAKLTPREREIVALIAQGATNRQIADALVITEGTAANHVLHILNKLGFGSRTQVAVWAAQRGLLPSTGPE